MMSELTIGSVAPDFTVPSTMGSDVSLSQFRDKWVVLYFYPKDCTSGCTLESQEFRDAQATFNKLNAVILGLFGDSIKSHHNFIEKEQLNFQLLSDANEHVCNLYQVIKDKIMYGKKVRGIERSTFLIDPQGKITQVWRKVKVDGHVAEVLVTLKNN